MKRYLFVVSIPLIVVFIIVIRRAIHENGGMDLSADVVGLQVSQDGFQRVNRDEVLRFPGDFGPHPEYQTEWWYYTGNLENAEGRHFGYQLTFFRRGVLPPQEWQARESRWGANQVYMSHFALSDITAETHSSFERFTRDAVGLAGAQAEPFKVWLENWEVVQTAPNQFSLNAAQGDIRLALTLVDTKGLVLHGDQGYSQKGSQAGNASYYFSQTRLASSGTVQVGDTRYKVEGLSWMDHEFSTSALSPGQVGWDWFSVHLDDGSDLMLFQIRRDDGSIDPFSSGTLVAANGETQPLGMEDFELLVEDTWRSSRSDAIYPSEWRLLIPSIRLDLRIKPYLIDQEMDVSYVYWEGAVEVSGVMGDFPVAGSGYVEMTGYAESMEGEF
jgi:predicted secreted hydrolase